MLDSSLEGKLFINKILQYNKNVYSLDDYNVEEWSLYKTSGQFFSPQITLNTSKIVPYFGDFWYKKQTRKMVTANGIKKAITCRWLCSGTPWDITDSLFIWC